MDETIESHRRLAEIVRRACLHAAQAGYVDASASGLCAEGAFEAAVGAMQMLDLDALVRQAIARLP